MVRGWPNRLPSLPICNWPFRGVATSSRATINIRTRTGPTGQLGMRPLRPSCKCRRWGPFYREDTLPTKGDAFSNVRHAGESRISDPAGCYRFGIRLIAGIIATTRFEWSALYFLSKIEFKE
jgi:hypothetical protein